MRRTRQNESIAKMPNHYITKERQATRHDMTLEIEAMTTVIYWQVSNFA